VRAERLGLVISPETHPSIGSNIQGPSVIRTPEWVDDPLGTYLCYFADHKGDHLRLAYANDIAGPWTVHPGGCIGLAESGFLTEAPPATENEIADIIALYDKLFNGYECVDVHADLTAPHIASPDVRVNHHDRTIEMWFHGLEALGWQVTRYGVSSNGVDFSVEQPAYEGTYLRTFEVAGEEFGIAMPGTIVRRTGGPTDFEDGPTVFAPTTRHLAVWVAGTELRVFFTSVGDAPERIMMATVDATGPWRQWSASEPIEVLRPERSWEGADLPLTPSIRSFWPEPANQLRDPAIFVDEDGEVYLFYAVAGESGIAVARLDEAG